MPKAVLLSIFLAAAASLFAQPGTGRITIQEKSIPVKKLLKEISRQSGMDFSYNTKILDAGAAVGFSVKNASLEETLDLLAQTIGVKYLIVDGQIVLNAQAQTPEPPDQEFILSGFLTDQATGEVLIGASVAVFASSLGTITNDFGFYSIKLKKGLYRIDYSYLGYVFAFEAVNLNQNKEISIALAPRPIDLPLVVIDRPLKEVQRQSGLDKMSIDPAKLNNLPEFGGESGLVRGLQSQPGVQTHSDASAFMYIRGGERDQNLIVIDDAPIYNPAHLFGFYSLVVPEFTKKITVHKSDLPASMGDRLSSIISIRTIDGNLSKPELHAAVNPLIGRLSVSAPMFKQRSAVFLSVRRGGLGWLTQGISPGSEVYFWDSHFKWNFKINEKNRLFLTVIQSGDVLGSGDGPVNGIRWGNSAATLRWNKVFSPRLFANTILYSGNYAYDLVSTPNYWKSELGAISLKSDFTFFANPRYTAKFGFETASFFITPGRISLDSTIAIIPNIESEQSRQNVLYFQSELDVTERLRLNLGFRFLHWANIGPKTYYTFDEDYQPADTIVAGPGAYNQVLNVDPRFSVQYQLDSSSMLSLSFGNYHQYLQLIQNSISPFTAFEVWLPAGPTIAPQAALQAALSYKKFFKGSQLDLEVGMYYKRAKNQIDYEAYATTYLNPFLESELRFGRSRAYGVEFMLKKDLGRLNGWMKYSYSRVFRKTRDINNEQWYHAFQDRPHDFALVLNYDLSKRIIGTAFWTSQSGGTFTSPIGFYTFQDQTLPLYGARNNDRLPGYHRLDFSLRFQLHRRNTARFRHYLVFSVYNVLAHRNVYAVRFNKLLSPGLSPTVPVNAFGTAPLSPSQISMIRFLPSLTYKFDI